MAQNRRSKQGSPGTAQGERNSKTTEQRQFKLFRQRFKMEKEIALNLALGPLLV